MDFIVKAAARDISGSSGVTFVLREEDKVFYADEDAIGPLWKGSRFPAKSCISGWAIEHQQTVVIPDIYADERIPHDLYKPTFVKSLMMVPIRKHEPIGAIGSYWCDYYEPTDRDIKLMEALAGFTATAWGNAQLYHQAQKGIQARDDFISIASHELRTPLTALLLQLQMMILAVKRGEPVESAKIFTKLKTAEKSARTLGQLIDRLLNIGLINTQKIKPNPENVDLVALVKNTTEELSSIFEDNACPVSLVAEDSIVGFWDKDHIKIVLQNLLANASKYGIGKPIEIRIAREGKRARLFIKDYGIGIGAEDQSRIFGRFERAVSAKHYAGFGLGLWLAQQLLEMNNGQIQVISKAGSGATFIIELPL